MPKTATTDEVDELFTDEDIDNLDADDDDEDLDDLFEDDKPKAGAGDDEDDLLDSIPEEAGEPWMPEPGEGIQGEVIERFEVPDEMKENETVPCLTLRDRDGDFWSVRGYRTILRREIRDTDPQIGDTWACRYIGPQEIKKGKFKGKDAHVYKARVRRAA